jgi:hypothetical protein
VIASITDLTLRYFFVQFQGHDVIVVSLQEELATILVLPIHNKTTPLLIVSLFFLKNDVCQERI